MKKRLVIIVLWLAFISLNTDPVKIFIYGTGVNAFAKKETGGQHPVTEQNITEETDKEIHTEAVEHPEVHKVVLQPVQDNPEPAEGFVPAPRIYYFYWLLLIMTFLILVGYFYTIHREAPHRETKTLALILVVLGITLYFVDQLPSLAGFFDMERKVFVEGYHESTSIGLIKFVYRIVLSILFVVYAFLGVHEEHKHEERKL